MHQGPPNKQVQRLRSQSPGTREVNSLRMIPNEESAAASPNYVRASPQRLVGSSSTASKGSSRMVSSPE